MSNAKSVEERLSVLEMEKKQINKRLEGVEGDIGNIEDDNKATNEILTILKEQAKYNEKQSQQFMEQLHKQDEKDDKFLEAITEINANITSLNQGFDGVKKDVSQVFDRVGKLEENGTININKLIKRIVWVAVPTLIVTGILIFIGWK